MSTQGKRGVYTVYTGRREDNGTCGTLGQVITQSRKVGAFIGLYSIYKQNSSNGFK